MNKKITFVEVAISTTIIVALITILTGCIEETTERDVDAELTQYWDDYHIENPLTREEISEYPIRTENLGEWIVDGQFHEYFICVYRNESGSINYETFQSYSTMNVSELSMCTIINITRDIYERRMIYNAYDPRVSYNHNVGDTFMTMEVDAYTFEIVGISEECLELIDGD